MGDFYSLNQNEGILVTIDVTGYPRFCAIWHSGDGKVIFIVSYIYVICIFIKRWKKNKIHVIIYNK